MYPEFRESRLRVHIAFHFNPDRVQYLQAVLAAIDDYRFQHIEVIIDTNTEAARGIDMGPLQRIRPRVSVHDGLDDPFELTWQHRSAMNAALGDFEYFMYLEDDIGVSRSVLECWLRDSRRLRPYGYRRGFLRTEIDPNGVLVSTDQWEPASIDHLRYVGGREWFYPVSPYHGFWIYSQAEMLEFVESQAWIDGNHRRWGIRERAAAGMIWMDSSAHRSLVPLRNGRICPEALVSHIPNNYALNPKSAFGSVPIDSLCEIDRKDWLKRQSRRLASYVRKP